MRRFTTNQFSGRRSAATTSRPIETLVQPLTYLWAGVVIGVSFLATPAKFMAVSLSRPVALDVGRATFGLLNRLEWVLAAGLVTVVCLVINQGPKRRRRRLLVATAAVVMAVIIQSIWLLPILDARVASIIAAVEPPPSRAHTLYGLTEVVKVTALLIAGGPVPSR